MPAAACECRADGNVLLPSLDSICCMQNTGPRFGSAQVASIARIGWSMPAVRKAAMYAAAALFLLVMTSVVLMRRKRSRLRNRSTVPST